MRTLFLILLFALLCNLGFSQANTELLEKRNVYNKKGDFYFDKNEFKKAISYYTLAYQKDTTDYFSVLKKAEAYTKLKWYPQAEMCYRIVFERNLRIANTYKLKYALALLANNKQKEFKHWLGLYSQIVDEEIQGENYLISTQNRVKLYKDTAIVLVSPNQKVDTIHFKVKYAGYQYRKRSTEEDDQIYLVLNNGDEHSIAASETADFKFSFQPMESYKMIIQQENIGAEDILSNKSLTPSQRKNNFLKPPPVQKDELMLLAGMKYQFSSGKYQISPQYLNTLNQLAGSYQQSSTSAVDLTALVKELQLTDGEVYSIRFVKADDPGGNVRKMEISMVTMNEKTLNIYGQSFILLLPDRAKENFAIQTDIEVLEKTFSPKKHSLKVDDGPLFKAQATPASSGQISLTVNTKEKNEVKQSNRLSAKEISIIPATEYIMTLSKPDPNTGEDIEVIVPLTRGVKYNFTSQQTNTEYKEELAKFLLGRKSVKLEDEEVINISILSKELDVKPGEDLSFSLLPIRKFGKQPEGTENLKSNLTIDERVFEISRDEKFTINVPFDVNRVVNFQTDLGYIQENFAANTFDIDVDTISFTSEISVDTSGLAALKSTGYLSVSVNTNSLDEVASIDQFIAKDVSIIPGKEYILTVSKIDAVTGKKDEIIVPLIRHVKYDFTSSPGSDDAYKESLKDFMEGREKFETVEGTMIDITLLSKELQIAEGDEISFSLLPVRKLTRDTTPDDGEKSSLYLDNIVVEFTHIHKYTINMPLNDNRQVNMQTNLEHLQENFEPGLINIDVDTLSFFSEMTIDTTGIGDRVINAEEEILDPVYDVVVINFDVNQHAIHSEARNTLQKSVIDKLRADKRLYVTIKGYTDGLGDADYNLNLSKRRAESVKEFLRSNGISEGKIRTFSFGASQSLQDGLDWEDLSDEELRKHRKVEIVMYLPE